MKKQITIRIWNAGFMVGKTAYEIWLTANTPLGDQLTGAIKRETAAL